MGQAQQGAVGDLVELIADGLVDLGDPVSVHVGPQGRHRIQVPITLDIDEVVALCPLDDQWLVSHPVALLCKRMPEVPVVEFGERGHQPILVRVRSSAPVSPSAGEMRA